MKKLLKYLMLAAVVSVPAISHADFLDTFCPYGGAEGKWQSIAGRSDWSNALTKSHGGGSIFLGTRFCDFLGLEVGYSELFNRTRKHTYSGTEGFFNARAAEAQTDITTRFSSGYLDLNGYYPCFDGCFDFIGSLGISAMNPRMMVRVPAIGPNGTGFFQHDVAPLESITGITKTVFRVGAGAQYMFCDCVGLRGMVRFENTSALRARVPDRSQFDASFNTDALRRPFRDSISLALGIFAAF
jgi:hypothetical protein